MGRWTAGQPVVTSVIGPGPSAKHDRYAFTPDYDYQEAEIDRRFEASAGAETYLGDWHTHPEATYAALSWRDRRTIARIAADPAAHAPRPVMIILIGGPEKWTAAAWIGGRRRLLPGILAGKAIPATTRCF